MIKALRNNGLPQEDNSWASNQETFGLGLRGEPARSHPQPWTRRALWEASTTNLRMRQTVDAINPA